MQTQYEIFVSSKMQELRAERELLKRLIPELGVGIVRLHAWVYEDDAYANEHSIRDTYLKSLHESELYIGIFWKEYGKYTIDEFNAATAAGMPRHIYVKVLGEGEGRDPRLDDFLEQIQAVEYGLTPFYFRDLEQLEKGVRESIRHWLGDLITQRKGSPSAIWATHPAMLLDAPRKLIGREDLIAQIDPLLDAGETVLLHGFGGMGKSALAATLAAKRINGGSVLWQRLGSDSLDLAMEALARPFNAQEAMGKAEGEAKRIVFLRLLLQNQVKLVVLDDAWNAEVLRQILEAIPPQAGIPVLVTSRNIYPVVRKMVDVGELSPAKALETLGFYADQDYTTDPDAAKLCIRLGNHAFALEVAGQTLRAAKLTPAELLGRLGEQPHKLVVPGEQRERTIEDLIHTSLTLLDEQTQAVFLAMGAFFDRQMTPEMLGIYMGRVGDDLRIVPPNDEPSIVGARHASPLPPHPPNSPSQGAYADAPLPTHPMEPVAVEQALETLMLRGLAEKIPAKSEPASQTCVTHYRLHDLAYSYAKANNKDEHRQGALDACLIYVRRYAEPILPNFAALRPELYNLLGAANWALLIERYVEVEVLAIGLYVSYTGDGFLRLQGYSLQSLGLLEIAAQAAERQENRGNQAAHLSHLGLAYTDLGRYRQAIDYHQQAMTISRKIGDRETESTILSNLGIVYRQLGQYPQAIDYAQQALTISHEIGDRRGEGLALEGLGVVYKDLGQYEQAIAYHQQALTISRDIGDRPSEGNALGNLGIVYLNLGQYGQGIDYCQQALTIAQEIGDRHGESNRLGNLGTAYLSLGQYKQAIHYYEQSLAIRREIEEWRGEGEILHNLGTAYRFLGEPQKALEYYHQARAIFVELGVEHLVTQTDQNIAALQGNSSRSAPPPASPVKTDRSAIKSQAQELRQLYRDGGEAAVREHLQAQGKSPAAIEVILEGLRKEGT